MEDKRMYDPQLMQGSTDKRMYDSQPDQPYQARGQQWNGPAQTAASGGGASGQPYQARGQQWNGPAQSEVAAAAPGQAAIVPEFSGQAAIVSEVPGQAAPVQTPSPPTPTLSPQDIWRQEEARRRQEEEHQRQVGAQLFGKLASASLIYALIYTFCLYKNMAGITVALWIPALLCYTHYIFQISNVRWKRDSIFVTVVMALLGISNFLTGNEWILWLNYIAVFLLLVALLLHNFCEDARWDFGKYLLEITVAVGGAIGCMFRPFEDGSAYLKQRKETNDGNAGKGWYIAAGVGIAVPCVLILGFLLASADLVFADMIERMFSVFWTPADLFGILALLLFGFFSSYCGVRFVQAHADKVTVKEHRTGEPLIAITVTGMIALLYLMFCVIQVVYLFAGKMQLPEGVTYAQYARRGFFQLLFVCLLNLILVLAVKKYFRESRWLNLILLVISGCTLVMTASSAYRMLLYIGAYQLTFLRIFVLVALLVIALLMAGVICVIVNQKFPLFRYGIVVVSVVYLAFSYAHVDYFIASYNLSQVDASGGGQMVVDYAYIYTLSTDAAPAIEAYLKTHPEALYAEAADGKASDVWTEKTADGEPAGVQEDGMSAGEYTGAQELTVAHADGSVEVVTVRESGRTGGTDRVTVEDSWLELYLRNNECEMNEITIRNFNVSHYVAKRLLGKYAQ